MAKNFENYSNIYQTLIEIVKRAYSKSQHVRVQLKLKKKTLFTEKCKDALKGRKKTGKYLTELPSNWLVLLDHVIAMFTNQ